MPGHAQGRTQERARDVVVRVRGHPRDRRDDLRRDVRAQPRRRTSAAPSARRCCQILGGDSCGEETAATPEKCLTGKTTTSANANVFVAFVQIDKDSILIREDYSDGSSKFTIVDNTEAAGELLAGAKAKAGKYGFNASAEALAGIGLAGGKVFEFDNPEDAEAFQDSVQAAGGFDGIVRDLAGYDDEIPILGWDNPLGGLNDWALDQLGIDDNGDLPKPNEEYFEGKAFLEGSAGAGGGIGIVDADIKGLIDGAGLVKVKTSGENKGDVEFTVRIDGEANGSLTAATLGGGATTARSGMTATITLDAQNGYKPDKLVLKGNAGYTGNFDQKLALDGDELKDISSALEEVSISDQAGEGKGFEVSGELDLDDPENLQATLDALARARTPFRWPKRWTRTARSASTRTTSPPRTRRARSRSASVSAAVAAAAPAARSRAIAPGSFARRAVHSPRASASNPPDEGPPPPFALALCLAAAGCGGGGGDFSGDPDVPDGYKTFTGNGVSFAYPSDWEVDESTDDGGPAVEITPPDKTKTPYGLIRMSVTPDGGSRFKSLADQRRLVIRDVNDGKIDSDEEVDIPGSKEALRATATTPPGQGSDPVEVKADSLDVRRENDDVVVLTVAAPQRKGESFDPAAIVDTFRLED